MTLEDQGFSQRQQADKHIEQVVLLDLWMTCHEYIYRVYGWEQSEHWILQFLDLVGTVITVLTLNDTSQYVDLWDKNKRSDNNFSWLHYLQIILSWKLHTRVTLLRWMV